MRTMLAVAMGLTLALVAVNAWALVDGPNVIVENGQHKVCYQYGNVITCN